MRRRERLIFLNLAILFLISITTSQIIFPQFITITVIKVKGNRTIKDRTLKGMITVKKGEELDYIRVREDIKKIFKSGYFSDVKVDAHFSAKGVDLTYIVKEKPVVFRVSIKGNDAVGKEELEKSLAIKSNDFFSEEKVQESVRKLITIYNNNSYFDVKVIPKLTERGKNRIEVTFEIKEGEKRKIDSINFVGNNFFTGKELKKMMTTKEKSFFSWLTGSGSFKKDVFDQDMTLIEVRYLDNGFLDVKVEKPVLKKSGEGVRLTIRIFEGVQYRVGKVRVAGKLPESLKNVEMSFETKSFLVFSREKMVKDILSLTKKLQDLGYADASINPRYIKQEKYPVVDINFAVSTGTKYSFGVVNVKGNTKTLDKVIRRKLEVSDGELYSATGLEKSKAHLMKTGYFKDVKILTKKGETQKELDVDVEVEEGPTGTLSGGFGFSSVDHFFGTVQVSENNLFGRGWKVSLNSQFGARRVVFNFDYRDPNVFDTDFSLHLNAFNTDVEFTDFTRKAKGGVVGFGYPISRNIHTNLDFRVDRVKITDVDTSIVNSVLKEEAERGAQITHSATWGIGRDVTDSFINPTRGSSQRFDIEYAGGILGGESDFVKYTVNTKFYKPIGTSNVYALHITWGHVVSTVGGRIPVFERYFIGGPNTIRGFESRKITPLDKNTGEEIGGNKELIINNEFLIPLYSEIGLKWVFFFDAGNTWKQGEWPQDFGDIRYGAGFGFRWFSPMGPLRLEWGFNLSPKGDEKRRVLEFTIGNTF